jgi:integrase
VAELVSSGLSAGSVRKIHSVLSGVLALAVKDRRIASNPCDGVNLPRVNPQRRKYLTAAQVADLADAAATPTGKSRGARTAETFAQNALVVYVLAYCGLRWGELAALRVSSVDLLRRRFNITESVSDVDGEGLVWTTPKDHETRSVGVPVFLVDALAAHMVGKDREAVLFPSHRGEPLSHRAERRAWFTGAAEAIGVPGLTPHELRHTAASLAVSVGANVKAVQRMLGHASAAMTLDTYADLFDDDLDAVAERLDSLARVNFGRASESRVNPAPVAVLAANA